VRRRRGVLSNCAVQVKRSDYVHCTLGADSWMKMILNCSEPQRRRRFTILFEPYQSIPRAPEYHPGGRYYFISKLLGHVPVRDTDDVI